MAGRNMRIGVGTFIGAVIIVVVVIAGFYVYFSQMTSNMIPVKNVTLYEGDQIVGGNVQDLFGLTQSSMTSPGPQLNFTFGDVVNITVYNVGSVPHNWAIVDLPSGSAQVMFNAHVASGDDPIAPGSSGSDVFQVTQVGNFYYLCQVPGHVDLGNIIVSD